MKSGTIPLEAGIVSNPIFCNWSLKLPTFEYVIAKDTQTYPTKVVKATMIIKSKIDLLDMFLSLDKNERPDKRIPPATKDCKETLMIVGLTRICLSVCLSVCFIFYVC